MHSVENKDDERLLWIRFLKGDNQVLSLIYLQYSNSLYDYGCRFTLDHDLVKDCIQEVFCTLIRTRKNLSETDNIRLYLLKALKRRIIYELNSRTIHSNLKQIEDYPFELRLSENLDDQLKEIEEDKLQLIAEAIHSLTERQKEAIYLRFNRGLEYEEISFLLNLNYQSSRALIHRAVEKIRNAVSVQNKKISQILFYILCRSSKCVF